MKNRSFFVLLSTLSLVVSFLLALIYKTAESADSKLYQKNLAQSQAPTEYYEEETSYILKEYEGALAVFAPNEKEPLKLLDIYPQTLPKTDREKLSLGISAKSYEELLGLIEDYGG